MLKILQIIKPPSFYVVQTIPAQNSQNININNPLFFVFNYIPDSTPKIQTLPLFTFSLSLDKDKKTLLITPTKPLSPNTNYEITISGKNIVTFTLRFKTAPEPIPTPPPTTQNTYSPSVQTLAEKLPIITDEYTIQYFANINKFVILILENPYEENKKEADSWFKEQGVNDLSSLNIEYGSSRGVSP